MLQFNYLHDTMGKERAEMEKYLYGLISEEVKEEVNNIMELNNANYYNVLIDFLHAGLVVVNKVYTNKNNYNDKVKDIIDFDTNFLGVRWDYYFWKGYNYYINK